MPFEVLDRSFMLLGLLTCREGSQILSLSRPRIGMSGIDPVLTRLQFTNHHRTSVSYLDACVYLPVIPQEDRPFPVVNGSEFVHLNFLSVK
jgi:hypothetical protein